jgi:metal-dependent HD superfamily phosphatase/phosphodiesterase
MKQHENSGAITIAQVRADPEVLAFIHQANTSLKALGYTEHGLRHAGWVGKEAARVLHALDHAARDAELAEIAGFLHDTGNLVHRDYHALSGAQIAWSILRRLGMAPAEVALVMGAIGNHEEERGIPTSNIAAAVIIADKADVHRSRVQNPDRATFDIHDRVNYAATRSAVVVDPAQHTITLELTIDTSVAQVMEYFEIFLSRMVMMRKAASILRCEFQLVANETRLS